MFSRGMSRSIIGLVLALSVTLPSIAFGLETFAVEHQAQMHCPKDTVVWLNLPTMIWHYKGQRWYVNTKHGAFACQNEAAAGGARGTQNGQ